LSDVAAQAGDALGGAKDQATEAAARLTDKLTGGGK